MISSCIFYPFRPGIILLWKSAKNKSKRYAGFVIYSLLTALYVIAASGYGSLYIWGSSPVFEVNAAIFSGL